MWSQLLQSVIVNPVMRDHCHWIKSVVSICLQSLIDANTPPPTYTHTPTTWALNGPIIQHLGLNWATCQPKTSNIRSVLQQTPGSFTLVFSGWCKWHAWMPNWWQECHAEDESLRALWQKAAMTWPPTPAESIRHCSFGLAWPRYDPEDVDWMGHRATARVCRRTLGQSQS